VHCHRRGPVPAVTLLLHLSFTLAATANHNDLRTELTLLELARQALRPTNTHQHFCRTEMVVTSLVGDKKSHIHSMDDFTWRVDPDMLFDIARRHDTATHPPIRTDGSWNPSMPS
jgi:hypothetical protein